MDRVAIITGAGSGIGHAVALALVRTGFAVALAGRHKESLEQTACEAAEPSRAIVVPTDVSNEGSVAALFNTTVERFGRLDLLFNNAGTGAPRVPVDELSVAQWNAVIAVNLTGAFLCARAAFSQMKRQNPRGGRIINNGSISAYTPRPLSTPYTATKHAITGLTKSLSLDGRAYDIACGQIDIGNAATAMASAMTGGVPQANGTIAVEPTIDVRHVADAILYMANLPLDANVLSLTVMANGMPFVGRG
ncbi:MAG: SDR family oxidoreductase [Alphaproteobacteria bacterium]|nr:SDR family oxidoreductase [Alphaproteobacteria bacterium]